MTAHVCEPGLPFTRLYDSAGTLYEQAGPGEFVPDTRTLADYQAEFEIEPLDVIGGMLVLRFVQSGKSGQSTLSGR